MGMEPLNSISSVQAQSMTKPATAPKPSSETTDGNTTGTNVSVPKVDSTTLAVAKNSDDGNRSGYENQEQNAQTGREALKKAVETINKNLDNSEAVFGIHDDTNRVTIKIVDKNTKEVIKELPPEKTLDLIAKAWEIAGLLVDEKR